MKPTLIPTSYKIAILGLLALAAIIYPKPAKAGLGDNYATLCKQHNNRAGLPAIDSVTGTKNWVYWAGVDNASSNLWVQFRNNRCESMQWAFSDYRPIDEGEIWRTLVMNSDAARWTEYDSGVVEVRAFRSDNPEMFAWLSANVLHLAYKSWIDRHHMWSDDPEYRGPVGTKKQPADNALPPVQEGKTI
jgi:hypothetical protein